MKKDAQDILVKTAETVARKNVNSACWFWLYQDKLPAQLAEKLKRK